MELSGATEGEFEGKHRLIVDGLSLYYDNFGVARKHNKIYISFIVSDFLKSLIRCVLHGDSDIYFLPYLE